MVTSHIAIGPLARTMCEVKLHEFARAGVAQARELIDVVDCFAIDGVDNGGATAVAKR
jgi:hypothetical protein